MSDNSEQPDLFAMFRAVDEACRNGDMEALRAAVGNPPDFPNNALPEELEIGESILLHAIYFAPVSFVGDLIDAGADVRFEGREKIPALFAAILCEREDRLEIMQSLLDRGADIQQLGYNDWTALHLAVNVRDVPAIALLVARGADPYWRAGEDQADTSAFDDALAMGFDEAVEAMLNAAKGPLG